MSAETSHCSDVWTLDRSNIWTSDHKFNCLSIMRYPLLNQILELWYKKYAHTGLRARTLSKYSQIYIPGYQGDVQLFSFHHIRCYILSSSIPPFLDAALACSRRGIYAKDYLGKLACYKYRSFLLVRSAFIRDC